MTIGSIAFSNDNPEGELFQKTTPKGGGGKDISCPGSEASYTNLHIVHKVHVSERSHKLKHEMVINLKFTVRRMTQAESCDSDIN